MRRLLATLIGSAVLACTASRIAAAEHLFVVLDYDMGTGLQGCPSASDFQRRVRRQLGYDPFRESAGQRVVVRVEATAHGLEGHVEWQSANGDWQGERRFSSRRRDCAAIARAMIFATAVQIQLLATTQPRAATPIAVDAAPAAPVAGDSAPAAPATGDAVVGAPAAGDAVAEQISSPDSAPEISRPATAAPSIRSPSPSPSPSRSPARSRSFGLGLGFGPSAGFGLAPGPSFDGRVFATLHLGRDRISVELGAKTGLPSTLRQSDGSGFSQYRLALTLAGCGHLDRWSACLLGDMGQTRVRGLGVDAPRSPSAITALAGFRVAMTHRVTELGSLVAHADVLGLLTPWTVTLNQANVWTMPRFAAALGIDFALRFR